MPHLSNQSRFHGRGTTLRWTLKDRKDRNRWRLAIKRAVYKQTCAAGKIAIYFHKKNT